MNSMELLKSAKLAMAGKEWDQAAFYWQKLAEEEGSKAKSFIFLNRLKALQYSGDLDEAQLIANIAMSRFKKNKSIWKEAIIIVSSRGEWREVVDRCEYLFSLYWRLSSCPAKFFNICSRAYSNLGEFDRSDEVAGLGLKYNPKNVSLLNTQINAVICREKSRHYVDYTKSYSDKYSKENINIKNLCECFWRVEEELELLSWQIDGVYVWPLIRMQLYYAAAQKLHLYDAPHPNQGAIKSNIASNSAKSNVVKNIFKNLYLLNGLKKIKIFQGLYEFLRCEENTQTSGTISDVSKHYHKVILAATRKINGEEPYTQQLRKEIGSKVLCIEKHEGSLGSNTIDLDALTEKFKLAYKKSSDSVIQYEDQLICHNVRDKFLELLGLDLGDIALKLQHLMANFIAMKYGFNLLLKDCQVKELYLTNSYGIAVRAALVAAMENGIRVVELQHGFISPYHLGYSWPGCDNVPYTPHELWCFGDYWSEVTSLPASVITRTIGAPYIKKMADLVNVDRQDDLVVFSSQGVIGRKLVEISIETAIRRPDKQIIFRLHPSESIEVYKRIVSGFEYIPGNFSLSHKQPVIFELLAKASIQVGAFSTTLLEGMSLGVKTVVINLPGIEYMEFVIERGDAMFVNDVDELVDRLDEAPLAKNPYYYYAEPVSKLII